MQTISKDQIINLFFMMDEFCTQFHQVVKSHSISDRGRHRNKPNRMSDAEVMLILIIFHFGEYRCLKHFYINYICVHCKDLFPHTVSYNRFVELESQVVLQLGLFVKNVLLAKCTGISFVDSTPLRVCKNQRIHMHKTFRGLAERGKCSMGWFYGFKIHIIINEKGEIINFMLTPANVDDRDPLKQQHFVNCIYGKLFADRGYISQPLFNELFITIVR